MDKGSKIILAGCSLFILENLVLSHNRDYIISQTGSVKNYQTIYSCLSLAAMGGIGYGYLRGRGGARWSGGMLPITGRVRWVAVGVQTLGIAGLMSTLPKLQIPITFESSVPESDSSKTKSKTQSKETPVEVLGLKMLCPIDFKSTNGEQLGLKRITRYPELFSLAFATAGSALLTPVIATSILLAFPSVFAVIGISSYFILGGLHQDYLRDRAGLLKREETSLVPFQALIEGRQSWRLLYEEVKWVNVSVGVILALGIAARRERRAYLLTILAKNITK
jgi:hypothetical protein